jgi:hypothetical protein
MSKALRPPPRTRLLAPALALLVAAAAAGCSGGSSAPADGPSEMAGPTGAPTLEVEPVVRLGRVTGALPRDERRRVQQRVARIAVRWLTAAYVGGSYPRADFDDAFRGFSPGARAAARRDLAVLTNAPIGRRVDDVRPSRVEVEVDLLAVDRRAVAATAHVLTTFETTGRVEERARVAGRLMLTSRDGTWNVFGYHVNKGEHR